MHHIRDVRTLKIEHPSVGAGVGGMSKNCLGEEGVQTPCGKSR